VRRLPCKANKVWGELPQLGLQHRNGVIVLFCPFLKRCDLPECIRILYFLEAHRAPELGKLRHEFRETELFAQPPDI
jgi:hypothetical protein